MHGHACMSMILLSLKKWHLHTHVHNYLQLILKIATQFLATQVDRTN